ncbi:P2X purinoceptor 7-like [Montipora capricornis]|uniref:P2X purinoceptor 7-like n=1 Tax=Montipora capricornis TaxID=246305 RepID=UPI0035F1AC79
MDSDDSSSFSSSVSSSCESADKIALADCAGTQPYLFEPYDSEASEGTDSNESSEEETLQRLQNTDWCACGNCQRLTRVVECICCSEIDCVVAKNNEAVEAEGLGELPVCITQHPGFSAVCLNRWVLQTAWYQYKQQYTDAYEGPDHKQKRHIAYRQLARWCWGLLGKQIRVVLPSCAVCCIRAHFPPPGIEDDIVFEGFRFLDE